MKRIAIIGLVILPLLFLVTCGSELSLSDVGEVVYTDVKYSADKSQVTIAIDGTKPFRTTAAAQRAMSRDLAMMAYDFLEVVFVNGTTIARSSWELGQAAGISGVARGTTGTGINYGTVTTAAIFAGRKSDKTLLGVGILTNANGGGAATFVDSATTSVTFTITAISTGLLVDGEAAGAGGIPAGTPTSAVFTSTPGTTSARTPLAGKNYPMYTIPKGVTTTVAYTFGGGAATHKAGIMYYYAPATGAVVQKRIPRYMENGSYKEPRVPQVTDSTVTLGSYTGAAGDAWNNVVPVSIVTTASSVGAFSFFIEVPVCAVTAPNAVTTNGGGDPIKWYIRTGLGSELYSMDDGFANGGCVLVGVGISAVDWIDIDWTWAS